MEIISATAILSGMGFLLWWYRQGKKIATLEFQKEENIKTDEILNEAKRIDAETSAHIADNSDPRAFWMSKQ